MNDPKQPLLRVMVVDDDPAVLESMRAILGEIASVDTVGSAERALVRLDHQHIDVIVADFGLPTMNGLDLLRIVSEKFPQIAGLLITGSDDYYTKGRRSGYQVMLKPVDPERLCARVKQLQALSGMRRAVNATRKTIDQKR